MRGECKNMQAVVEKEWYTIKQLQQTHIDWWSESSVYRQVKQMEENKDFKEYVIRPTGRTTLVNYEGFIKFLKWKDKNKFKG